MKHTTAFAALAFMILTLPAVASNRTLPAVFHGNWCLTAENDQLYRRGKCAKGVRIEADGYSHKGGYCRVTGTFQGPKALLAGFDCKTKGNPQVEPINMWLRLTEDGQLNMWFSEVAPDQPPKQ